METGLNVVTVFMGGHNRHSYVEHNTSELYGNVCIACFSFVSARLY